MTSDKLGTLAPDLTVGYPRSPRERLGGYVIAARALDKCRATLAGKAGEYRFGTVSYLDRLFFEFAGIDPEEFKSFVAGGADDAAVARWIEEKAVKRPRIEVIKWNNRMRELRLSDLPERNQEFMEDYIPKHLPAGRIAYRWFDVYDIEEKRL